MDLESARRRALAAYQAAAAQGDALASERLGTMYYRGDGGLPKDDTEAVRHWNVAATKGNAAAWNQLGTACFHGVGGLTKDEGEAVRCFREAAQKGYPLGFSNLGLFYFAGCCGLTKDDAQAVRHWRDAIRVTPATLSTWSDWMASKSLTEVREVLYQTLEQGFTPPLVSLSHMYLKGLGGLSKNEAEALRLLEQAAEKGNLSAKEQLDQVRSAKNRKRVAGEMLAEASAAAMKALIRNFFK